MIRQACAVAAVISATLPACAGAVPYAKLMAAQIQFEKLPPETRDKILLRVVVAHQSASDHTPIHLWVDEAGGRTPIPLAPDGGITLPSRLLEATPLVTSASIAQINLLIE